MAGGDGLLTKAEWAKHPASKKPGASYKGYRRWVLTTRQRRAQQADPFAPVPEATIGRQVRQQASAQLDPLLAALTSRTDASARAIEGLTSKYAESLGGVAGRVGDVYGGAQQRSAAVAESLANRLAGQGAGEAAGLRDTLKAIDAPERQIAEVAGGTEQLGRGAANAGFAVDSAALQELISRGAGAEEFAELMPGFARQQGIGAIGDIRSAAQQEASELRAQLPALVADLLKDARDKEFEKALAREGFRQFDQEMGLKRDTAAFDQAATADRSAAAWARIQQAGERIQLQGLNTSFNQALANAQLQLSQEQYRLAVQREQRLANAPKKGGATPGQKREWAGIAVETAEDDVADGLRPVETLRDLIAAGIPFSIAIRAIQSFGRKDSADEYWRATLGWTKRKGK